MQHRRSERVLGQYVGRLRRRRDDSDRRRDEKCNTDYENAAIECSKNENDAQRKTCQDGAYAAYRSCHDNCQRTSNSKCDDKYQDCIQSGPNSCLKKVAGKSLCNRCWERCNAGDSP
jgi:hypothetical protein